MTIEPTTSWSAADALDTSRPALAGLLASEKPAVRRSAVRLLADRSEPGTLDALWRVHCEMQSDPQAYHTSRFGGGGNTSSHLLYEESFAALRAGVRLEPEWLVAKIQAAFPTDEYTADLAYLVSNLEDGGAVWRRCKTDLFRVVPEDKRRSLATNIGIWRDLAEIERLEEWAGVDHDRLGPAAVRAMSQIDPARAVKLLHRLPPQVLYLTRKWSLPRLFRVAGDAVRDVLREHIRKAADPLRAALVYQGDENCVDAATLELLLDGLEETLEKTLSQGADRDTVLGLFVPLELLVKMGRADLLPVFARRRDTLLENRLVDLLIDFGGPRQMLFNDFLPREPAMGLLLRIGGDGYGRVTRAYLAGSSQFGRLDGEQFAVSSADDQTLAAVASVGTDSANWDDRGTPLVQMVAARTLAAHGDLPRLLDVMWFLGPSIPYDLDYWLPPGKAASQELAGRAMDAIYRRDQQKLPGSLLFLGYASHKDAAAEALAVLREARADHACLSAAIVCLGCLREADAIQSISDHLADPARAYLAITALRQIGTDNAILKLSEHVARVWDARLAIWLAARPGPSAAIVQLFADQASTPHWTDDVAALVAHASEGVLSAVIGRLSPDAIDVIRATAFTPAGSVTFTGRRRDAIRCLYVLDSAAAITAAASALADVADPDRPLYPPLLYSLDPAAARAAFIRAASSAGSKDQDLLWSLAHSLRPEADADWLANIMGSARVEERRGACHLAAGPCGAAEIVSSALQDAAVQPSHSVNLASEEAISHIAAQRAAKQLVDMVRTAATPGPAAALAAAAISIGQGGPKDGAEPDWFVSLVNQLHQIGQPGLARDAARRFEFARGRN